RGATRCAPRPGTGRARARSPRAGLGRLRPGRVTDPAGVAPALARYFRGALAALAAVQVDPAGTPFQRAVWAALRTIPHGETTSYGALAKRLRVPTASRAVGAANGADPLRVGLPGHRGLRPPV